jgi:hypothetical protein
MEVDWRDKSGHPVPQRISIDQCDAHRILEVDSEAREFKIIELDEHGNPVGWKVPALELHPSGKTLTITIATIDTGEHRQFFGRMARHLITKENRVAEAGACSGSGERVYDNWLIDFEMPANCPNTPHRKEPIGGTVLMMGGCRDKIEVHRSGVVASGFPVETKITATGAFRGPGASQSSLSGLWEWLKGYIPFLFDGDTKQNTTSISKVTELSQVQLDSKMFEAPADYKQVLRLRFDGPLTAQ